MNRATKGRCEFSLMMTASWRRNEHYFKVCFQRVALAELTGQMSRRISRKQAFGADEPWCSDVIVRAEILPHEREMPAWATNCSNTQLGIFEDFYRRVCPD
jgi:hypothetical protein